MLGRAHIGVLFVKRIFAGVLTVFVLTYLSISAYAQAPSDLTSGIIKAAQAAEAKEDLEGAARLYESAIVSNPASVEAYVGLGKAQAALERPQAAKRYFATAVKIDPNDLSALEAQSTHMIALGDLTSAEKNINRLKRLCVNGCSQLSAVLNAYEKALEEKRSRVLGEATQGS